MKVKLFCYSQPTEEFEDSFQTISDLVAYCARVSNPSNQYNTKTTEGLLDYLTRNAHWSPFEMVSATLEIETTRDIARQLLRHRSFTFQEFSQRYADPTSLDNPFVLREARLQDLKNRQNSIDCNDLAIIGPWIAKQQELIEHVKEVYDWAIDHGIAKEQARVVLPEGNTVSRLYVQGTIRSWIHYIQLRSGNGTQLEHIELARAIAEAISKIFPDIEKYTQNAVS